jgi:four helix bundle protein
MTIKTFEDIQAWKRARTFAASVYTLTLRKPFSKDFTLKDQINRSCGSIMDNIAEGFERDGKNEFIHMLSIAKGSSGESRSQLYRALDRQYISLEEFEHLKTEVMEISRMIWAFMNYLKRSDLRGTKFTNRSS